MERGSLLEKVIFKRKVVAWREVLQDRVVWGLVVVMLLGGIFRFYNLNWDKYRSFHPDERNIIGQAAKVGRDTGFRVDFFAYGQLPVYLYRATAELISVPEFWVGFWTEEERATSDVQESYWLGLVVLFVCVCWFVLSERMKKVIFGGVVVSFGLLLITEGFPIFWAWLDVFREWGVGTQTMVAGLMVVALGLGAVWWAWVSRWGRLLLAVLALWGFLASQPNPSPNYVDYQHIMVIGRWWSALFSTLTIGAVFLLVRRVYRHDLMALVAAAGLAFSVINIQVAHYAVTESLLTLMVVVVALAAYEVYRVGNWRAYLIAGVLLGLALAAKTSAVFYGLMILAAHVAGLAKKSRSDWLKHDKRLKWSKFYRSVGVMVLLGIGFLAFIGVGYKSKGTIESLFMSDLKLAGLIWNGVALALVVVGLVLVAWGARSFEVVRAQVGQWVKILAVVGGALLVFFLLSPWSVLDWESFRRFMDYEWRVVSLADVCYVLQFKDTTRYIFFLKNLVQAGLWWPLGVFVLMGGVWVVGRFVVRLLSPVSGKYLFPVPFSEGRGFAFSWGDLLMLSWFIPYFGFVGAWNTKFIRYMVPLVPFLCVFGARFLVDVVGWIKFKDTRRIFLGLVIGVVIGGSLFYSVAYMHVYRFAHPWIEASVWIFENVPLGSMILKEHWDDGLPTYVGPKVDARVEKEMGPNLYRQEDITIYELHGGRTDDSEVKKRYYAQMLQQGDYISIASKKLWYTLTDMNPEFRPGGYDRYPVTSRYYRLLWSGQLGYKMVAEFHNFPGMFGWEYEDDGFEDTFSVYDHSRVYIFKKVEDVSPVRIVHLLGTDDYVRGIDREMMRKVTPDNVDEFIESHEERLREKGLK